MAVAETRERTLVPVLDDICPRVSESLPVGCRQVAVEPDDVLRVGGLAIVAGVFEVEHRLRVELPVVVLFGRPRDAHDRLRRRLGDVSHRDELLNRRQDRSGRGARWDSTDLERIPRNSGCR